MSKRKTTANTEKGGARTVAATSDSITFDFGAPTLPQPQPCPHCGYCPTGKRASSPAPMWPYYPSPWVMPTITWATSVMTSPAPLSSVKSDGSR